MRKSSNYHSDSSDSSSIRQRVLKLWSLDSEIKARKVCKKLRLDYPKYGKYVNSLLSSFRYHYNLGSPQKPHRTVFEGEVEASDGRRRRALKHGWKLSKNRNGMLKFDFRRDHVHWYWKGTVMVYFNPAKTLGHAKQLFWKAFEFLPFEELLKCVDTVKPFGRSRVFDLEERLPKAEIRYYRDSHGLNIKLGDGSHPTCVEVDETEPFWLRKFATTVDKFGEDIDSHNELIKEWREEARTRQSSSENKTKLEIHALIGNKELDVW